MTKPSLRFRSSFVPCSPPGAGAFADRMSASPAYPFRYFIPFYRRLTSPFFFPTPSLNAYSRGPLIPPQSYKPPDCLPFIYASPPKAASSSFLRTRRSLSPSDVMFRPAACPVRMPEAGLAYRSLPTIVSGSLLGGTIFFCSPLVSGLLPAVFSDVFSLCRDVFSRKLTPTPNRASFYASILFPLSPDSACLTKDLPEIFDFRCLVRATVSFEFVGPIIIPWRGSYFV